MRINRIKQSLRCIMSLTLILPTAGCFIDCADYGFIVDTTGRILDFESSEPIEAADIVVRLFGLEGNLLSASDIDDEGNISTTQADGSFIVIHITGWYGYCLPLPIAVLVDSLLTNRQAPAIDRIEIDILVNSGQSGIISLTADQFEQVDDRIDLGDLTVTLSVSPP